MCITKDGKIRECFSAFCSWKTATPRSMSHTLLVPVIICLHNSSDGAHYLELCLIPEAVIIFHNLFTSNSPLSTTFNI